MHRRAFLAGSATVVGLGAGCLSSAEGGDYDVGMALQAYEPRELTVSPGTEVVWRNTSSRAHTVTAYEFQLPDAGAFFASGGYDSTQAAREAWRRESGGGLYGGETFAHTFEEPGSYPYFCIPHERGGMKGRIVVEG